MCSSLRADGHSADTGSQDEQIWLWPRQIKHTPDMSIDIPLALGILQLAAETLYALVVITGGTLAYRAFFSAVADPWSPFEGFSTN